MNDMDQFISKSAVVEEIERRVQFSIEQTGNSNSDIVMVLLRLKSFLDTIEVKEINNVWNNASDFPKAEAGRSILLIEDNGRTELLKSPSTEKLFYFRPTNLKMWAYVDELTTHSEVKEVDLDLEITLWANAIPEIRLDDIERLAKYFYELGLKAQKRE